MRLAFALTICSVVAVGALTPAQTQATTLAALSRDATSVARVRVVANRVDEARVRVRLAVVEILRGDLPDRVELTEPAGRSCGRSLWGLVPGAAYLAFLETDRGGVRLAASSSRSLVLATPGVVAHVGELVRRGRRPRIALLAAALDHADPRVREDAAIALPSEPGLEQAPVGDRRAVLRALLRALERRDGSVGPLLAASSRCPDPATVDVLLPLYTGGSAPELDRAVLRTLARCDSAEVARRLPGVTPTAGPERLVDVARGLAPRHATSILAALAISGPRPGRIAAQAELLRRGSKANDLVRMGVPVEECDAARAFAAARPAFRSIDPWGSRRQ